MGPSLFMEQALAFLIYVDESGDLGWTLDKPYQKEGSSRHLTIAALLLPGTKEHHAERTIRQLYKTFQWRADREQKWVNMPLVARVTFAKSVVNLREKHPEIRIFAIVVKKENVKDHIRKDANKLYNYMLKLLLVDEMTKHQDVILLPDPRSIKVESGNSLHDYLQMELWFECNAVTRLETTPLDSKHCLNIQFADMLAGVIQSHFELGNSAPWEILKEHIFLKKLYF